MRGCQRKIIMLRGTDSQIFDEAYFLLRKDCDAAAPAEAEMLREAQRLVDLNTTHCRTRRAPAGRWLPFAAGLATGAAFFVILSFFL